MPEGNTPLSTRKTSRRQSATERRYLTLDEKAVAFNLIADEGIAQYGPKAHLYTKRFSDAHQFFTEHPELRQPQEAGDAE